MATQFPLRQIEEVLISSPSRGDRSPSLKEVEEVVVPSHSPSIMRSGAGGHSLSSKISEG